MQQEWNKPTRPSPVMFFSAFFDLIKEAFGYLIIFLAIGFFRKMGENDAEKLKVQVMAYSIGILVAVTLFKFNKILGWFFTRFWIEGEKIILTKGVFVKKRLELPLAKIQTVQLQQNIVHRLTNTCSVSMDTAGSSQAEFVIEALKTGHAHALQQWIKSRKNLDNDIVLEREGDAFIPPPMFHLQALDFVKLCISENHLKSLALMVFFILGKVVDLSDRLGFDSTEYLAKEAQTVQWGIGVILLLLFIGFVIAVLFSTVQVLFRYYNFTVRQQDAVYEMTWGLFTRQRKLMPFNKVEFVTWWSNWMRRKINVFVMRFHSLAEPLTAENLQVQVPVTNRAMHNTLISSYIKQLPHEEGGEPVGIEKAYVYRRMLIIGLPITLALFGLLYWLAGWYAFAALIWFIYFVVAQYIFYKNFCLWVHSGALQIQKGIWGRQNLVVYLQKILYVSIRTSPWQRRHGYATLDLHLPGVVWTIPYLKIEQARFWADYITLKIEEEIPDILHC
jgi:putative membrane protein